MIARTQPPRAMNLRSIALVVLAVSLFAFGSCTGGVSGSARRPQPNCGNGSNFCLVSCNLGCQLAGTCSVTSIAQNQPIELEFSDLIDAGTVTAGSVSLKTANGESPAGRFVVDGARLVFLPEVRIQGGVTTFGFRAGATYILSLNAAATGGVLSSVSGDRLARSVVCSLRVTQGLVDLDGAPPSAELVLPTATTGVQFDSPIVIRFSELIDASSFNGASTIASPIIYQIRRTVPDPSNPSIRLCEPGFQPVLIQGVPVASVEGTNPPRSVITLQPATALPNRVCVEVILTGQVRDLAGNSAARRTFLFFTDVGVVTPQVVTETFANDANLDRDVSSGTWGGGRATPARLGGSGVLGSFDYRNGVLQAGTTNTYVIDTANFTVPATQTLFGGATIVVNDGVFDFTDFVVPSGIKVVFRGAFPALIKVRGVCQVEGEVSADGATPSSNFAGHASLPNVPVLGQNGGAGGAGGGAGGRGADGCRGTGALPENSGRPGGDCLAPAASGYAGLVAGSGGPGGSVFPTDGQRTSVTLTFFAAICAQCASGGSGGAFLGAGEVGHVIQSFTQTTQIPANFGPDSLPPTTVPFTALPGGVSSLDHFMTAGSGGGGGGSHPLNMLSTDINGNKPFTAGAAGAGGGGAIAFRIGHLFTVGVAATVSAKGGGGALQSNGLVAPPAPGGGGSGGTVLVQIADRTHLNQGGTLNVSGGPRGNLNVTRISSTAVAYGGAGGHGAVRFEADTAFTAADLGTVVGPPSILAGFMGTLDPAEGDQRTGCRSRWRASRQLFAPLWNHYRLTCRVNGVQVVYSDDPANFNPADSDTLPVRIWFQGAKVNATNGTIEGEPGPWRDYINSQNGRSSINSDDATGFRFMLMFNRDVETDVVVEDLELEFEA